jgi:hypothetical protein
MRTSTRFVLTSLVAVTVSAAACGQKPAPESRKSESQPLSGKATYTFEQDTVGTTPKGFTVAETKGAGTPAKWPVEALKDDPKRKNVVKVETKNLEAVFNLLLTDAAFEADVSVSVDLKAGTGEDDQGGGLLWRAKDANNYYVARWNPLEKNLRAYKVVDGVRTQLQSVEVEADPKTWHNLVVAIRGKGATIAFDGKPLIFLDDATFPDGGKVGLWTKADASTWFDNLVISPDKK